MTFFTPLPYGKDWMNQLSAGSSADERQNERRQWVALQFCNATFLKAGPAFARATTSSLDYGHIKHHAERATGRRAVSAR